MKIKTEAKPSDADLQVEIDELFDKADQMLFKERKFQEAEALYRRVFELQPTNIYAVNSIAYCVKFVAASGTIALPDDLFE